MTTRDRFHCTRIISMCAARMKRSAEDSDDVPHPKRSISSLQSKDYSTFSRRMMVCWLLILNI